MSNFAAVQQAGGTNVIMSGQIVEFKGEGVGKTGKPWKKVVVEDMERERHTVTIRGNLPGPDALNQPAQLTLSVYAGTYQGQPYTGYSGFCDLMPNYGQPTQQVPAPAPQAAPQAAPAPYSRQPVAKKDGPDWDAKDERIVRQNTLNRAVELYLHTANPEAWPLSVQDEAQICLQAEKFRDYVYNGLKALCPGDQFAREQGLPTMEEEAAMERGQQPAF